jgi:TPR repeat protein
MYNLGWLYANARGVARNYAEARRWYEKAAAAGDADAMNSIGVLYHNGQGVPRDLRAARQWYEKALAAGNELARENLAALDRRRSGSRPRSNPGSSGYRSGPSHPRYPMRSPALCANRPAGYPGC